MGEEIPSHLKLHLPGTVKDLRAGKVLQACLENGQQGGEEDNLHHAATGPGLEIVDTVFDKIGDGRRAAGG